MADEINTKLISDLLREVQPIPQQDTAVTKKELDAEEVWGDLSQDVKADYSNHAAIGSSNRQSVPPPSTDSPSPLAQQHKPDQITYCPPHVTDRSRSRSRSPKSSSGQQQSHSLAQQSAPHAGSIHSSIPPSKNAGWERNNNNTNNRKLSDDTLKDEEISRLYLRLRGLPYNARERELFDFLGFSIDEPYIAFRHDNMGRFCGECTIKCIDQAQYERISSMHMRNMGRRYIEVFPADKLDFSRARESQNLDLAEDSSTSGTERGEPTFDPEFLSSIGIVKIRGLPYEAQDSDITQFFKDSQIIPNGIQKVFDGRRPTGEAFILFATKADAQKALEKDKQRMGSRYIETFLCHPKEYTHHIKYAKSMGSYGPPQHSSYHGNRGYPERQERYNRYGGNQGYNNSYGGQGGYRQYEGQGQSGYQPNGYQGYRGGQDYNRQPYKQRDDSRYQQPYQAGGYEQQGGQGHYGQQHSYGRDAYSQGQGQQHQAPIGSYQRDPHGGESNNGYYYGNTATTQQPGPQSYSYPSTAHYGTAAQSYMGVGGDQTTQQGSYQSYYQQNPTSQVESTSIQGYHTSATQPPVPSASSYYSTSTDAYQTTQRGYPAQ